MIDDESEFELCFVDAEVIVVCPEQIKALPEQVSCFIKLFSGPYTFGVAHEVMCESWSIAGGSVNIPCELHLCGGSVPLSILCE